MSFGYFAGPQAITSDTTRYVPSSPAQLSTVVVHQQEGPASFAEAESYYNDPIVPYYLLSAQWMFMEYIYAEKNQVSPNTVLEAKRFWSIEQLR